MGTCRGFGMDLGSGYTTVCEGFEAGMVDQADRTAFTVGWHGLPWAWRRGYSDDRHGMDDVRMTNVRKLKAGRSSGQGMSLIATALLDRPCHPAEDRQQTTDN